MMPLKKRSKKNSATSPIFNYAIEQNPDAILKEFAFLQKEAQKAIPLALPLVLENFLNVMPADQAVAILTAFMNKPTLASVIHCLNVTMACRKQAKYTDFFRKVISPENRQTRSIIWTVILNESGVVPSLLAKIYDVPKEVITKEVENTLKSLSNSKLLNNDYEYALSIYDVLLFTVPPNSFKKPKIYAK